MKGFDGTDDRINLGQPAQVAEAQLLARLLTLPREFEAAEEEAFRAGCELTQAKADLEEAECRLTLQGLPGANEPQRKAALLAGATKLQEAVRTAQERVQRAAKRVRVLQAEAGCLRATARLLGAGEGQDDA